ncbi:MAG: poly-gamma-glutamate capsule biosynthesis protein CapA/YwtB (metallophosphatase superfamily) [Cyclobacteriaceae bacterium]|jgi:poly-gamma-glutamate synthesis protein (capsule biosynthesis protein)
MTRGIVKYVLVIALSVCIRLGYSQAISDTLKLTFVGDIMGHDSQIAASIDQQTGKYDYNGVFDKVAPIFKESDFTIANLEVTLAGPPFKGYPQFSSPDGLAVACKENGIDVLVTANNHSCDRRKSGIIRTIDVLDSLEILHTGTFRDAIEKHEKNLLILDKNNIKIGLLNYTYGTNGIPAPAPTIVNNINWDEMAIDIEASKSDNLDKLIVFIHWGTEYESHPTADQEKLTDYLFNKGVDIIIGSHPHVIQRMEYRSKTADTKERFIAYSLGNFVSNQRKRKRDGGVLARLTLVKDDQGTRIDKSGYHLIWVNKPKVGGRLKFQVVSGGAYENKQFDSMDSISVQQMNLFLKDSRELLNKENIGVGELTNFPEN